ncbi:helix-turn-helix domain-containing protein [Azospirillum sp.]|uniref:helix-turn-helix domain-containing protein n=1 Tax=Azospirillum sp. TaxID=34012 RepID=UPI003D74FEC6
MPPDTKKSVQADQCRAARALLGWSQDDLEREAGVAKKTIADFERGARTPYPRTLADIRSAFERAGLEVIDPNGGGAGVRWRENPANGGANEQPA